MRFRRNAFTLIEVLISITLLSFVLLALYNSLGMLRKSNTQLFQYLQRADKEKEGTETLFLDIAGSDGNITIKGDEFTRLCLENSVNSLYGLSAAKVCWLVSKEKKLLLRSEGNGYTIPLASDDAVEVDVVMDEVELFRVYRKKSDVLVLLQRKGKKPVSFMVQGVPVIPKKKRVKKVAKKPGNKAKSRSPRPGNNPSTVPGKAPSLSPDTVPGASPSSSPPASGPSQNKTTI